MKRLILSLLIFNLSFLIFSEKTFLPLKGSDIVDGSYSISVDSSSSMFRVEKASLVVDSGSMRARLTLSGKGYKKLFPGKAEAAQTAPDSSCFFYSENSDGKYEYEFPVTYLNEPIPCAAYSTKKKSWYDRDLIFWSYSLPQESILIQPFSDDFKEIFGKKDGAYTASVKLTGGTGKAFVSSPAVVTIKDGQATARLVWSSANYDYMKIYGQKYTAKIEKGKSVFEIPVMTFDGPFTVIADTTAMSAPHEISYQLEFDAASIKKEAGIPWFLIIGFAIVLLGIASPIIVGKIKIEN